MIQRARYFEIMRYYYHYYYVFEEFLRNVSIYRKKFSGLLMNRKQVLTIYYIILLCYKMISKFIFRTHTDFAVIVYFYKTLIPSNDV